MADSNPFQDIERVFGLMSQQFGTELAGVPADVVDAGEAFVVRIDLPGYDREDVDVTLTDGRQLEVSAERRAEDVEADGRYVQRERRRRGASRTVTLPAPVTPDGTSATYEAGVLEVRLAKETTDGDGADIPVS